MTAVGWWPASFADRDTHFAVHRRGDRTVTSLCGRVFYPLAVGHPPRLGPLPGPPPDPSQVCPDCQQAHRAARR